MSQQGTHAIFFDTDRMPRDQEFDPSVRRAFLEKEVEGLKQQFPTLQMDSPIDNSCVVPVRASEEVIAELTAYLHENHLGTVTLNGSMIRSTT